jgi:Opioid growth factor receptor (OGFr) conserved region
MPTTSKIIHFYANAAPDHRGRYLLDILRWPDESLEATHDYIQWLFPLSERSGFNFHAPILDPQTMQQFRARLDLKQNLHRSFVLMLTFYGLQMDESRPARVVRAPFFVERSANWLTPGNHNHLRITRILKSVGALGLEPLAAALFDSLATIYTEESTKAFPSISAESFHFWKGAVGPNL